MGKSFIISVLAAWFLKTKGLKFDDILINLQLNKIENLNLIFIFVASQLYNIDVSIGDECPKIPFVSSL